MVQRYQTQELKKIWSEEAKYKAWLEIEILSAEAFSKINKDIKKSHIAAMRKNAKVNVARIHEIELETRHDVVAFTRQISETLGEEKKWVHYGLTSTDVVDSAQAIILRQANIKIAKELQILTDVIKKLAIKHKLTYQMGRTHGVHAEISTFGYKMALWYDEMNRNITRFADASKQVELIKISGAVGNYANIPLSIQEYVADKLKLGSAKISTQTLQRDRHAQYVSTMAIIASSLDKFATELRHLQRTEVREVQEGFGKGQKGSSAMPHKKNPISSENISGLSRVMRGYMLTAMENIPLWHERDISHSSAERFILPDSTSTLHYMLRRFTNVLKNIGIKEEKMKENIFLTNGVIFSQRAMLELISKKKMSREQAYDIIQPLAIKAFENELSFKDLLLEEKVFNLKELDILFDLSYYSQRIDQVFARLGLITKKK